MRKDHGDFDKNNSETIVKQSCYNCANPRWPRTLTLCFGAFVLVLHGDSDGLLISLLIFYYLGGRIHLSSVTYDIIQPLGVFRAVQRGVVQVKVKQSKKPIKRPAKDTEFYVTYKKEIHPKYGNLIKIRSSVFTTRKIWQSSIKLSVQMTFMTWYLFRESANQINISIRRLIVDRRLVFLYS